MMKMNVATLIAALCAALMAAASTRAQCTPFVDFINARSDLSRARGTEFFNPEVAGAVFVRETVTNNRKVTFIVSNNGAFDRASPVVRERLTRKSKFSNQVRRWQRLGAQACLKVDGLP